VSDVIRTSLDPSEILGAFFFTGFGNADLSASKSVRQIFFLFVFIYCFTIECSRIECGGCCPCCRGCKSTNTIVMQAQSIIQLISQQPMHPINLYAFSRRNLKLLFFCGWQFLTFTTCATQRMWRLHKKTAKQLINNVFKRGAFHSRQLRNLTGHETASDCWSS
jgi:hypothetical protein